MGDEIDRYNFAAHIHTELSKHPDWLDTAIGAISSGMQEALRLADMRAAKYDRACMAAMALCDASRVTQDTKTNLGRIIAESINPDNASESEKKVLARYGKP
jgi:hypothetical protein